jgi:K+:H+ antiporter
MELIVLNVALDLGALKPTLFTMLVLMAVVTTVATTPVLHLLRGDEELEAQECPGRGELSKAMKEA